MINLLVLSCVNEKCSSAVCIESHTGSWVLCLPASLSTQHHTTWMVISYTQPH